MPRHHPTAALCVLLALALWPSSALPQEPPSDFERRLGGRMLSNVRAWLDSLYYDSTYGGKNLGVLEARAQYTIDTASSRAVVFGAVAQFLQELNDSHTRFFPPDLSVSVDYGWSWQMFGNDCFVVGVRKNSDAERQGLVVGDKVLSLDGIRLTRDNTDVIRYVYHLLSPRRGMRLLVERLDGSRATVAFEAKVSRRVGWVDLNNLEHWRMLWDESDRAGRLEHQWKVRDSVALWRFTSFGYRDGRLDRYMGDARRYPWLILDLRSNPGGAVEGVTRLLGHFFDDSVPGFVQRWRDSTVTFHITPRGRGGRYQGQVIVLLDSESASGAEMTARVLQRNGRAMVVGDRSSGHLTAAIGLSLSESASGRLYLYGMSVAICDVMMPDGEHVEETGGPSQRDGIADRPRPGRGPRPGHAVRPGAGRGEDLGARRGEDLEVRWAAGNPGR
jgi:C-terminal processing protease CtpA/Prc